MHTLAEKSGWVGMVSRLLATLHIAGGNEGLVLLWFSLHVLLPGSLVTRHQVCEERRTGHVHSRVSLGSVAGTQSLLVGMDIPCLMH